MSQAAGAPFSQADRLAIHDNVARNAYHFDDSGTRAVTSRGAEARPHHRRCTWIRARRASIPARRVVATNASVTEAALAASTAAPDGAPPSRSRERAAARERTASSTARSPLASGPPNGGGVGGAGVASAISPASAPCRSSPVRRPTTKSAFRCHVEQLPSTARRASPIPGRSSPGCGRVHRRARPPPQWREPPGRLPFWPPTRSPSRHRFVPGTAHPSTGSRPLRSRRVRRPGVLPPAPRSSSCAIASRRPFVTSRRRH